MFPHVRMVRRALVRNVERHVDAVFTSRGEEPLEILQRPELRVDRLMTAFGRPDGPYSSGVARADCDCAVLALAMRDSYAGDEQKVKLVEPHRGNLGQALLAV